MSHVKSSSWYTHYAMPSNSTSEHLLQIALCSWIKTLRNMLSCTLHLHSCFDPQFEICDSQITGHDSIQVLDKVWTRVCQKNVDFKATPSSTKPWHLNNYYNFILGWATLLAPANYFFCNCDPKKIFLFIICSDFKLCCWWKCVTWLNWP